MFKIGKAEVKEMIRMYKKGATLEEIAESYKMTKPAVLYHLRKNNVETRRPGPVPYSVRVTK